mmetsp:Transcript_78167/g.253715  ORF Transcript_78167/g.253715 Transcript_78167/m.253715 type:complete len:642 (-) Transcript_78167:710-2635(-)
MSTTPHRLYHLEQVLKAMTSQTYQADAVYLVLPRVFLRDWAWYDVPWWYIFIHHTIKIVRCEQDYRPATGLLCVLQHEPDPDTYLVVVDDDVAYHPMLIERLLNRSHDHPGSMIGAMAYHSPGAWCRVVDEYGICGRPNLAHTTYGLLFQRRFFDGSILNLGAAAKAYIRQRPDRSPPLDYIVTSCMITDNSWYEAHLAKKAIPRVFYREDFGARPIAQIAFGRMSLFAGYQDNFFHSKDDPHSIDDGEVLCLRALVALWGPGLWTARPRQVAAASLRLPRVGASGGASAVADGAAAATAVARQLSGISWWNYDGVVLFACTGRPLPAWRALLEAHGGLANHLTYLHLYAPELEGALRAPFASELFDPGAFRPPPLQAEYLPASRQRGFRPTSSVGGDHANAGAARPLAELVELCPERPPTQEESAASDASVGSSPTTGTATVGSGSRASCRGCTAPSALPTDTPEACPKARMVRDACRNFGGEPRVEENTVLGFAGVKCCWQGHAESCVPNSIWRNQSWLTIQNTASCLPQIVNYYDAHRTCEAVGMGLCDAEQLWRCCHIGCNIAETVWLRSPPATECVTRHAEALRFGASAEELAGRRLGVSSGGGGGGGDRRPAETARRGPLLGEAQALGRLAAARC